MVRSTTIALLLPLFAVSCTRAQPSEPYSRPRMEPPPASGSNPTPSPSPSPPRESLPPVAALPSTRLPAPARLVAIGDVHGDLTAFRNVLRLAGAIDEANHWSGGALVVVQTGDILDRGDDEREILDWVQTLAEEASRAGGAVHVLNGNHEIMNVQWDFRYVTPGGFEDFHEFASRASRVPGLSQIPEVQRARAAAFAPNGPYARRLAGLNTVQIVGDTAFVHGGLLPEHVEYGLQRINDNVRGWMLAERANLPTILEREDSPVWHRRYALQDDPETCALLQRALEGAQVRRLVIGHTPQRSGINSACEGRVWRIDVGLARYYNGPSQALEIVGDTVRVLGR